MYEILKTKLKKIKKKIGKKLKTRKLENKMKFLILGKVGEFFVGKWRLILLDNNTRIIQYRNYVLRGMLL